MLGHLPLNLLLESGLADVSRDGQILRPVVDGESPGGGIFEDRSDIDGARLARCAKHGLT